MYKDIPDFPGYLVSDSGKVLSQRQGSPKKVKPLLGAGGYLRVGLWTIDMTRKSTKHIHQLVLLSFVGPKPFPKAVCRHLDGNPLNNSLNNLCYGTQKENIADAIKQGTFQKGTKNRNSKLTDDNVCEIIVLLRKGTLSQGKIGDIYGVGRRTIGNIHLGRNWSHIPRLVGA